MTTKKVARKAALTEEKRTVLMLTNLKAAKKKPFLETVTSRVTLTVTVSGIYCDLLSHLSYCISFR